jgi:two-component system, NarL family, invasion response regulator UvrY
MTTVLIIDDHPIVLQGCRRMLEDAAVTDVIEAADAASGYQLFSRIRPQVVIIDLGLHDNRLGGLELMRRIRADDTNVRILVFSMHCDPVIVARALQAGATGYVVKDTSPEHLSKLSKRCAPARGI